MFETTLQKYPLEEISRRTKILRRNLEKLKKGEFSGLTRPQAMGFVRILEREFGVELSDLRHEIESWFEAHPTVQSEPIFLRDVESAPRSGNRGWLVAFVLVGVLLFGYYLFRQEAAPAAPSTVAAEEAPFAKSAVPAPETNASKNSSEATSPAAVEKVKEAPAPENDRESAAVKVAEAAQKAEPTPPPKPFVPLDPVEVVPRVKLWMGVIDLDRKKRWTKVTAAPFTVDSHGRKLLITGHGRFELSDGEGNLYKFNDAKKHYFLIEEGRAEEIGRDRFKRLNGGKTW